MAAAAAIIICGSMTAAAQTAADTYTADLLKVGDEAPGFVIENGDTLAGTPLSHFRGRYVVLDFWASWCGDCRREIPAMKALYDEYASDKVVFIGVSVDEKPEAWRKCIGDNGMRWIHHSELKPWKSTRIAADYRVKWIPTVYIVGPDGRIALATIKTEELREFLGGISARQNTAPAEK